jgi:hypothetical protein
MGISFDGALSAQTEAAKFIEELRHSVERDPGDDSVRLKSERALQRRVNAAEEDRGGSELLSQRWLRSTGIPIVISDVPELLRPLHLLQGAHKELS